MWNSLYLYRYLVRWSILTSIFFIFELGWNHQLALHKQIYIYTYIFIKNDGQLSRTFTGCWEKSRLGLPKIFAQPSIYTYVVNFQPMSQEHFWWYVPYSYWYYIIQVCMYIYIHYLGLPNMHNIWFWVLVEHVVWTFPHIVLYPAAASGLAVSWLMSLHGRFPWVYG